MTQQRTLRKKSDTNRGSALLGRALGELARVRDELGQWKQKANALQAELHEVRRVSAGSDNGQWRLRAEAAEKTLGDVRDQNRMLRMASHDLEAVLDDQDAQIESLIKHCAALEGERAELLAEQAKREAARAARHTNWTSDLTQPLERLRQRLRRQRAASSTA